MRAVCESCHEPQPADWQAGDLCTSCGEAVRREVRCFWCVSWVPAASFCRNCGAAVVEERLFGAARMLKDAGSDRFTIPKQLVEFPAEQIENFSRIYQRHAIAVARHVGETRFLEGYLRQRLWSSALEDSLIKQLPWSNETLDEMSRQPSATTSILARVIAIEASSPIGITRSLASVVRLHLHDLSAYDAVVAVFRHGDSALRAEAALELGSWRIRTQIGWDRSLARELLAELTGSRFTIAAAVARGLLGSLEVDQVRQGLGSSEGDVAIGAALLLNDRERLLTMLQGEDLERVAAGRAVIESGGYALVARVLADSTESVQHQLLEALVRRTEEMPELGAVLMDILETTTHSTLRERCARLLCRRLRPEWALRIARSAQGEPAIFQSLLSERSALPSSEMSALLGELIAGGLLGRIHYGLMDVAKRAAVPDSFVPEHFIAADEPSRMILLAFAEQQLLARGDESLHRFMMSVVFGPYPAAIRAAAWWALHRWYRSQGDYRGEGPLRLGLEVVVRFFGSMAGFLPGLIDVISDPATMVEVGVYEMLANVLGSADVAALQAIQAEPALGGRLVAALLDAIPCGYWPNTRDAMIILVSRLGAHARWRSQVMAGLSRLPLTGNYHFDQAMRRLALACHDIPEEAEWGELPGDFVSTRFAALTPAGQHELLLLAEHQLIHHRQRVIDAGLQHFLLVTALAPGDETVRIAMMRLYHGRIPRASTTLNLSAAAAVPGMPPFPVLIDQLAQVLANPILVCDPGFGACLGELFDSRELGEGSRLAACVASGQALVAALLQVLAIKGGPPALDRLRRILMRYLIHLGPQPAWASAVVAAVKSLMQDPSFDLRREGEQALAAVVGKASVPT